MCFYYKLSPVERGVYLTSYPCALPSTLSDSTSGMSPRFLKRSYWALSEGRVAKFGPTSRWSNKDMDPVPVEGRTWRTWDFIAYWISDATNAAVWQLASSMLAVGLSWRQALPAIAIGNTIIAVSLIFNLIKPCLIS